jgi:hypothetical protein
LVSGGVRAGGGQKTSTAARFTQGGKALKGVVAASPKISLVSDDKNFPTPIYAARPKKDPGENDGDEKGEGDARKKLSSEKKKECVVYGLYSAVTLADPVRCRKLFDELPSLFKQTQWQEGPYMYQSIPGLVRAFPTHHTPPLRLPILVPEGTIPSALTVCPYIAIHKTDISFFTIRAATLRFPPGWGRLLGIRDPDLEENPNPRVTPKSGSRAWWRSARRVPGR